MKAKSDLVGAACGSVGEWRTRGSVPRRPHFRSGGMDGRLNRTAVSAHGSTRDGAGFAVSWHRHPLAAPRGSSWRRSMSVRQGSVSVAVCTESGRRTWRQEHFARRGIYPCGRPERLAARPACGSWHPAEWREFVHAVDDSDERRRVIVPTDRAPLPCRENARDQMPSAQRLKKLPASDGAVPHPWIRSSASSPEIWTEGSIRRNPVPRRLHRAKAHGTTPGAPASCRNEALARSRISIPRCANDESDSRRRLAGWSACAMRSGIANSACRESDNQLGFIVNVGSGRGHECVRMVHWACFRSWHDALQRLRSTHGSGAGGSDLHFREFARNVFESTGSSLAVVTCAWTKWARIVASFDRSPRPP